MSDPAVHDPYAALRLPSYRLYASAFMLAVLGQQVQSVAIGYDLYRKTGSTMALGFVGLVQAIPVIGLALPAGQLADRFDRRRVLILSQIASALTTLGLIYCYLTGAPVQAYYGLLMLDAAANALGWPARTAIMTSLVPMEILGNAITWNSSFMQVASVAGPAIGGLILIKSIPAAYCVDVAASIWYITCLCLIRTRPQERSREPVGIQSLLAGLRFVFRQKIILATITLDLFAVLLGGAVYLMPAVAQDVLHVEAWGLGLLRSAPAVG